jgi:SNF2 family DNA or RNA helicase
MTPSTMQGKTVQVIALMAALLEKKGSGEDRLELDRREEIGRRNRQRIQDERDYAVRNGRLPPQDFSQLDLEFIKKPAWAPILLLVPTNIVDHWKSDINLWGHFAVSIYRSGGAKLTPLIESIQMGISEILLCSTSMFQQKATLVGLKQVEWKLIIIDELHFAKSKKTLLSKNLRELKGSLQDSRVIGLTGTPLQNKQVELWNIVDLVIQGHLGTEKEFETVYGKPIRVGRYVRRHCRFGSIDCIALTYIFSTILPQRKRGFIRDN